MIKLKKALALAFDKNSQPKRSIIVLIMSFLLIVGSYILSYICGYLQMPELSFHTVMLIVFLATVLLLLLLIDLFRLVFSIVKGNIKDALTAIVYLAVNGIVIFGSFFAYVPGYIPVTMGLLRSMENKAEISEIRNWLNNYEIPLPDGNRMTEVVEKELWNQAIVSLNPGSVFVKDTGRVKYARLNWGGPFGRYGLIVGENIRELPLNVSYASEYRLFIDDNSCVWYQMDR